jgi:predicted transcriptional regulator
MDIPFTPEGDPRLENQARFVAGVQRGIEQADRGEFVEHKDVLDRIGRLFKASE